jgi:Ca2+-binding EF-hand superfamily protein
MGDRFTEDEVRVVVAVRATGLRAAQIHLEEATSSPHSSRTYTHAQADEMFRGAPVDDSGRFDYREYTRVLKHGSKEEA